MLVNGRDVITVQIWLAPESPVLYHCFMLLMYAGKGTYTTTTLKKLMKGCGGEE